MEHSTTLDKAKRHQKMRITGLKNEDPALEHRLLEMGFVEGAHVMLLHEAPFSKDPIIVRLRNSRIAIRRKEAAHIMVEAENSNG